ncbi:MAG: hypothetical protein ACK5NT_14960 [Pyrinomonadaceae bacterium]
MHFFVRWFKTHSFKSLPFFVLFISFTVSASAQNYLYESDRWEKSGEAIIISDMSQVEPRNALTFDLRRKRHWKVLDYETKDGLKGNSIASLPDTGAPAVTLKLNKTGWFAVYVGLGGAGRFGYGQTSEARKKLTNDVAYQHRRYSGASDDIDEVFFKNADLTGQDLEFAQMRMKARMNVDIPAVNPRHTVIMYVKLVPLTPKEVAFIKTESERTDTKNLIGTMDGFSWLNKNYPTTKEEFLENFEHFRDSDFGTLSWQIIGGDLVNYDSKLGTIIGDLSDDPPRSGDIDVTRAVKKFIEDGADETKLAVEAAHSMNKKISIGFRTQAWQAPPAFEDYFSSRFYRENPQFRTYDRDGTPVMRMSYAVPEVREHIYGIFKEILNYQPDGLEIIYFRGLPLMLWEDAFSNRFKEKYGADAKQIPEDDPRLSELRCEIMTDFMRKTRKLLDDVQKAQGREKRYELSVSVVHTEEDNKKYGLDVEQWVKEGLIDKISIFPAAFHTNTRKPVDFKWFAKITKGTKIGFYPIMIGAGMASYEDLIKNAQKNYAAGAAGMMFWDPDPINQYKKPDSHYFNRPVNTYWSLVSRIGHKDDLSIFEAENRPSAKYIPLKKWGNHYFGRWIPDVGF